MRTEHFEFPATADPLDSYLTHCTHSRPAYHFLLHHLSNLGDEYSCILAWHTSEEEKCYAWGYIQRIHSAFHLRIVHLAGGQEVVLIAAEELYNKPTEETLERALDALDDVSAFPPQSRRDVVRFVKDSCDAQLFEMAIAELADSDISRIQAKSEMLHELRAYCSALGA